MKFTIYKQLLPQNETAVFDPVATVEANDGKQAIAEAYQLPVFRALSRRTLADFPVVAPA